MDPHIKQDRVQIKADARERLRGLWGRLFLACLLPSLSVIFLSRILGLNAQNAWVDQTLQYILTRGAAMNIAIAAMNILVMMPMRVSMCGIILHTAETGERPNVMEVFSCFDRGYVSVVRSILPMQLRLEAWSILSVLASYTFGYAGYIIYVALQIWVYNRTLAYMFTPFIAAENPGISGGEALARSIEMTRGRLIELLMMILSFIGWMLFAVLTAGIALVYALPYEQMTETLYYIRLRGAIEFEVR